MRRLSESFYTIMAADERFALLRAMYAEDLGPMTTKLAAFLNAWLGGPRDDFDRADAPCMMSLHKRLPIGASATVRAMIEPAFARLADAMRSR